MSKRSAASPSNSRLISVGVPAPMPTPMTARPSDSSQSVAHWLAVATGLRTCGVRMPVQSRSRVVLPAMAESVLTGQ